MSKRVRYVLVDSNGDYASPGRPGASNSTISELISDIATWSDVGEDTVCEWLTDDGTYIDRANDDQKRFFIMKEKITSSRLDDNTKDLEDLKAAKSQIQKEWTDDDEDDDEGEGD